MFSKSVKILNFGMRELIILCPCQRIFMKMISTKQNTLKSLDHFPCWTLVSFMAIQPGYRNTNPLLNSNKDTGPCLNLSEGTRVK